MSGLGPRTANTFSTGAPAGYVAGVGRGAFGFTTRSDIGPARPAVDPNAVAAPGAPGGSASQFGAAPAGYVAGRGRGMGDLARQNEEVNAPAGPVEKDRADYSESNYDEFSGYGGDSLAFDTPYDAEDLEADRIYEAIDDRMEGRHKRKREDQAAAAVKTNTNRPRIGDQFADLKRELSTVSADEWESLPEVLGDNSLKLTQQKRHEVVTPMSNFALGASAANKALSQSVSQSGDATPMSNSLHMAEARGVDLSHKLDTMSDSVTGQTVIDPKGYLTSLSSTKISSSTEIGDIKKARNLLGSVTSTNPKHAPGWIASARIEEFAGKMVQARKIIRQGCEICHDSEDVWLEAARLHSTDNAKTILANAVKHIPLSVKIWLQAAELETAGLDAAAASAESSSSSSSSSTTMLAIQRKKVVLRRALEFIPNSVLLWKTAIQMETVTDARIMLARAVECIPHNVDMWLALAKIETYENARKVLNQAREAIPTDASIWISAAKLEEAHRPTASNTLIDKIIEKALMSLQQHEVVIDREQWLKEAESAEESGALLTCQAIVKKTICFDVDEEDMLRTLMDDADLCLTHFKTAEAPNPSGTGALVEKQTPMVETARAIYRVATGRFPSDIDLWLDFVGLEKDHGDQSSLDAVLKEAVKECPQSETLWLMAAKEKWVVSRDVPAARRVLMEAFQSNPNSESIWLAAVKLEWENQESERARALLAKARDRGAGAAVDGGPASARVWMKSAMLDREINFSATVAAELHTASASARENAIKLLETELELIDKALLHHPTFYKLYLMGGQVCEVLHQVQLIAGGSGAGVEGAKDGRERARDYYMDGAKKCAPVASTADKTAVGVAPVYPTLPLWLAVIRLEEKYTSVVKARSMIERAKQGCISTTGASGIKCEDIWLEAIQLERRCGGASSTSGGAVVSKGVPGLLASPCGSQNKQSILVMAQALQELPTSGLIWSEEILTCTKQQHKGRSLEALKRCDGNNDFNIILAVARVFERDGKAAKSRKWYQRAMALAPRCGDIWAYYYRFELKQKLIQERILKLQTSVTTSADGGMEVGEEEVEEAVPSGVDVPQSLMDQCVAAKPNRGQLWCTVTKRTENRHLDDSVLLKKCVEQIEQMEHV